MFDENLLKKFKLKNIEPELIEQLEPIRAISPSIFDPENTLHDLYKEVKKQKNKNKIAEKKLKEAEEMILNIGTTLHHDLAVRHFRSHSVPKDIRPRGVEVMTEGSTNMIDTKIKNQTPLARAESIEKLGNGNGEFRLELGRYKSHNEQLKEPKEYDAVILICADARDDSMLFRDFTGRNILVLKIAGNPYDPKDKRTSAKIDTAIRKLKTSGELLVIGHTKCGAVDANAHEHDYVGKISPHVDRLVSMIDRTHSTSLATDDYMANCINQATRLETHPEVIKKDIHISPCLFDFNDHLFPLKYLKQGTEPLIIMDLRESGRARLAYAKEHGYNFATQYAHAIVLCDAIDLGKFNDPLTFFNARLNELFAVSFIGKEIASDAIASVEYSLLKVNGVKDAPHIVIVHTDRKIADHIKELLLKESEIIRNKTKNGELITIMHYNPLTGQVEV